MDVPILILTVCGVAVVFGLYTMSGNPHTFYLLFFALLTCIYMGLHRFYTIYAIPQQLEDLYTKTGPEMSAQWLIGALTIPLPDLTYKTDDQEKDFDKKIVFVQSVTEFAHAIARYLPAVSVAEQSKASYDTERASRTTLSTVNTYVNQLLELIWTSSDSSNSRYPWILYKPMRRCTTPALLILALYMYVINQPKPFDVCNAPRKQDRKCERIIDTDIQPSHPTSLLRIHSKESLTARNRTTPCIQVRRMVAQYNEHDTTFRQLEFRPLDGWISTLTKIELSGFFQEFQDRTSADAELAASHLYAQLNPPSPPSEWTNWISLEDLEYLLLTWALKKMNLTNRSLGGVTLWSLSPLMNRVFVA